MEIDLKIVSKKKIITTKRRSKLWVKKMKQIIGHLFYFVSSHTNMWYVKYGEMFQECSITTLKKYIELKTMFILKIKK